MDDHTWNRGVAVCGILFIGLTIASTIVAGNPPSADARIERIVSFYTDNRSQQLVSTYLSGLSIVAAMFFFGGLWRTLRRAEGSEGALSLIAFGAAFSAGTIILMTSIGTAALAYHAAGQGDPAVSRALFDTTNLGYNLIYLPLAVFLVAAGLVMIRTSVIAGWLGWVALPVAALELLAAASFAESGPFMPAGLVAYVGLIVFTLWVLGACLVLLIRVQQPARGRAATVTA